MQLTQYLWMVIVAFMFGFAYAFGIGANDVANAFATVVASKSLTLKQAVLVAAIFEFLGAILLGASVTNTVRNKIFDVDLYDDEPEILLLGMFSALITGTFMLLSATALALPVSTTHTIVGSIMGFSIVAKGFSSINWPIIRNIVISWVVSPLATGIVAFCFFGTLRMFVMKSENAFDRAFYTFPIILTITVGINVFYVLYKGFNNLGFSDELPLYVSLPAGFGAGLFVGLIWVFAWGPWAKARILRQMAGEEAAATRAGDVEHKDITEDQDVSDDDEAEVEEPKGVVRKSLKKQYLGEIDVDGDSDSDVEKVDVTEDPETLVDDKADVEAKAEVEEPKGFLRKSLKKLGDATYNQDLHAQSMHESEKATQIWDDSEKFDPHAEQLFTYVQVFTSCMDSFAHGANDVANAIAPLSAILLIYQTGELQSKAPVQKWILAYGGLGIVVGLLLYGYKVIKSIGFKLSVISPSRGSMAELASSLFVVTASFLSIPVSTTQSQVGAVAGIGCVGGLKNVDWWFFSKVCFSWMVVFFSAAILSAGIFSMFAFTPSLTE
jgi:sodium-dependent phosphate transporter